MVANIGPADYNYDETISTLRYANRAKNIKNKPRINEDPKDAMLREFQEEIARLKQQLASSQGVAAAVVGGEMGNFDPNSKELRMSQMELSSIKKKIQEELMADMRASISDDVGIKVRKPGTSMDECIHTISVLEIIYRSGKSSKKRRKKKSNPSMPPRKRTKKKRPSSRRKSNASIRS